MTLTKNPVVGDAATMTGEGQELGVDLIPEEMRRSWFALAADLERRQADLSHLVGEVRRAIATFDKAVWDRFHQEGDLSDEEHDGARSACGIARLSDAVDAAGLGPLTEMCWSEVEAVTAEATGGQS